MSFLLQRALDDPYAPLRGLVSNLRCIPPLKRGDSEMAAVLSDVCARGVLLGISLETRPKAYTRTCAYYDDRFEVLMLRWAPGAASPIHDHGGQHCWLAVLDGTLAVENYRRTDGGEREGRAVIVPSDSAVLGAGQVDVRSDPFDIHRVYQTGHGPATSLHVYARPLQQFTVYDEFAHRCEVAHSRYDALFSPPERS